ncbi:hypothetical protein QDR37_03895 [Amnibacterium sp. CER49]|uniref:hypothetical protein n=1 Tax=Amnibacterium sp. CER49 TaxID=3039161 RepID=UPI00244BA494|nr:hypothetical protein [Amnibacterium sp. CER49]MDH2443084.1 hypothetical protein [Amnibacterium sp. CER49]
MGEHTVLPCLLRAAAATALAAAVALPLTSCSMLGSSPASAETASPAPTDVIDPSIPTPTATPTDPSTTVPTPTPAPTASTPGDSPAPTPVPSTVTSRTSVTPFVTAAAWDAHAGALTASALVSEIVEQGGTCTLTATQGSTVRTATSTAVAASSYTACPEMSIPGAQLSNGTWTVRVTYSSSAAVGTSAVKTVQVAR